MFASVDAIQGFDNQATSFESFDLRDSAWLMVDAYKDTVDWRDGDEEMSR